MSRPEHISLPTQAESEKAAEALNRLRPAFTLRNPGGVKVVAQYVPVKTKRAAPEPEAAELPPVAVQLLRDILAHLANGTAVQILPLHAKLTTQQAADFLNVSRPYLVRLLEEGKLKFERVGTHRRVLAAEVIRYQREQDAEARRVADELTAEAEKLGLGY